MSTWVESHPNYITDTTVFNLLQFSNELEKPVKEVVKKRLFGLWNKIAWRCPKLECNAVIYPQRQEYFWFPYDMGNAITESAWLFECRCGYRYAR